MRELNRQDLAWAVRRLPCSVRDLLKKHGPKVFLAGGYLRAVIAGEKVSDIDLFIPSKDYGEACAKELAGDGKPHVTDNAFTVRTRPTPTQFIHRWVYDSPAACLTEFDFTIAQAAIWWNSDPAAQWMSLCADSFYEDLSARRLVYTSPKRIEDAGGSMLRVLKFYQKGYRIPLDCLGGVIARLAVAVKEEGWRRGEEQIAKVITGLLHEVDPNIDPDHIAHLPSTQEEATKEDGAELDSISEAK